jgi:membrane protein
MIPAISRGRAEAPGHSPGAFVLGDGELAMRVRAMGQLLAEAGKKFWSDRGPRLGAAMAFYTALSLSPLLVVVVAIAGFVFGAQAARGELVAQLRDTVGVEGATVIEKLVAKSASPAHGVIATVIAIVLLLFGASGIFAELQSSLNTIWRVPGKTSSHGIWSVVKGRLLDFAMVCASSLLLLISLVGSAVLSAVSHAADWLPGISLLTQIANFVVTFGILVLLFAMIFQWLPETDLAWSDVWVGAAVTAFLFSIGKYLIGLYLARATVGSAYGAAGAFVILLVWIYYSTQIVLFGAELTYVYARRFGHGLDGMAVQSTAQSPSGPELRAAT